MLKREGQGTCHCCSVTKQGEREGSPGCRGLGRKRGGGTQRRRAGRGAGPPTGAGGRCGGRGGGCRKAAPPAGGSAAGRSTAGAAAIILELLRSWCPPGKQPHSLATLSTFEIGMKRRIYQIGAVNQYESFTFRSLFIFYFYPPPPNTHQWPAATIWKLLRSCCLPVSQQHSLATQSRDSIQRLFTVSQFLRLFQKLHM